MADALPLRIFLASPGDQEDERRVVAATVEEYNARHIGGHVTFEVVGWDRVRGTARRSQEAINELLAESHFVVTLFKSSWGSEPGSPWGYTSGTEEELFTGLLELAQPDQPMRDVWVGFVDHPAPDERITALRQQMSRQHSMMYESIADQRDLKEKLGQRLESWAAASSTAKVPRHVDLLPSSGKDVLRAANLRLRGEKLVMLGQPGAGRDALKEATVLGGPVEHLAYGRFLARHGDLAGAYDSTQAAIDHFSGGISPLYSPLAAEAFAAQAGVLRRQGRDVDAIGRLEQALTLLDEHDPAAQRVRCRILDELGLAHQKVGDLAAARPCFEASLAARQKHGQSIDQCQSLINLARLEVADGDMTTANEHAENVVSTLRGTPPTSLHANAEVLMTQIRIRQERPDEGIPHAERALSVNRQIANKFGEAISQVVLAQCHAAAGRTAEAARHAQASVDLNAEMGNEDGMRRARALLDQLDA